MADDLNIVILDGYVANPGDLSWQALHELGNCQVFDRTPPSELLKRCRYADVIITNKVAITEALIGQLPSLLSIVVSATGYDIVDVESARRHDVLVQNVPAYSTASVAQLVFAHLLHLTNRVADHAQLTRQGEWAASPDWCFWKFPQIELAGLTLGVVGLGQIGRAVARIGLAFGMQVIGTSRSPLDRAQFPELSGVEEVSLETLLQQSHAVTLHCQLNSQTHHLVDADSLALMKPGAFLINTSRGGLVDAAALEASLSGGKLAGAGLDVLAQEPPAASDRLTNLDHCFVTPHVAWATRAARQRLMETVISNVRSLLDDDPQNVVSH